jgi:hypothetical protein
MYSSIEEPISSPAFTLDITNIIDNPIATAAIVVGGGVTVGPIAAAYFALPVALAAEMLAPTAVEEVAGAAVGEALSTVTPETMKQNMLRLLGQQLRHHLQLLQQ